MLSICRKIITFLLLVGCAACGEAQTAGLDVVGRWQGQLVYAGQTLSMTLELASGDSGALEARWSVPERHVEDVPLGGVRVSGDRIEIELDHPGLAIGALRARIRMLDGVQALDGDARFAAFGQAQPRAGEFLLVRPVVEATPLSSFAGVYHSEQIGDVIIARSHAQVGSGLRLYSPLMGNSDVELIQVEPGGFVGALEVEGRSGIAIQLVFEDGGQGVRILRNGARIDARRLAEGVFDAAPFDAIAERWLAAEDVPGAVIGFVEAGRLVHVMTSGRMRIGSPAAMRRDAVFQIGSLSKTFLAALVVRNPDHLYRPMTFFGPQLLENADPEVGRLTPAELLTHTSGLVRDPYNLPREAGQLLPYSAQALTSALAETRLQAYRGRYHYSNFGFALLGQAVAERAELTYAELLDREILEPLAMSDTGFDPAQWPLERLAGSHGEGERPRQEQAAWRWGEVAAQGGLHSTVDDLAIWLSAQMGWGSRLSAGHLESLQMSRFPRETRGSTIGLAWWVDDLPMVGRVIHHGGEVDGQASWMGFSPTHQRGVIVLANMGGDTASELGHALLNNWLSRSGADAVTTPPMVLQALLQEDWARASQGAEALTTRVPDNGYFHFLLGNGRLGQGYAVAALEAFERSEALGFATAYSRYNQAAALMRSGRPAAAIDRLESVASMSGRPSITTLMADPDFLALHDVDRWEGVVRVWSE